MAKAPKKRPPREKAEAKPRTAAPKRESAGRPSEYKPEYAAVAKKLCELGATDSDLAEAFEVCRQTIFTWRASYPDFRAATEVGKESADDAAERRLYERAVADGDVTALIFWLKNRRPSKWRDRSQHELSGPDGGPIQTEGGMSDREAARVIAHFLLTAEEAAQGEQAQENPDEETPPDADKSGDEPV